MKQFTALLFAALVIASMGSTMFGQTLTTLATFNGANGDLPVSGLVADATGNLYGTTFFGGAAGYGTLFEIDATTHALTTVASFDGTNGANPENYGRLAIDAAGNVYGTTEGGGSTSTGTVFEYSGATHSIATIATFDELTSGYSPGAGLTIDTGGNLYTAASFGGSGAQGTIVRIDGSTHAMTVLASFNKTNGAIPECPPVVDVHGNLFGTTGGGGSGGQNGTIYEIDAATHTLTTVATFNGTNGIAPTGLTAFGGKLYGISSSNIFEFDPATGSLTSLFNFILGPNSPEPPQQELAVDASGHLYGTTLFGGSNRLGSIFEFDPATSTMTTLFSLDGVNTGSAPMGVFLGTDGNLYGTTTGDSSNAQFREYGLGTVFELSLPEPSALALLVLGTLGILARKRRRVVAATASTRREKPPTCVNEPPPLHRPRDTARTHPARSGD